MSASFGAAPSWERVRALLLEALELDPEARSAWLDRLAETEPAVAREVRELVGHADRSGDFLAAPALGQLRAPPVGIAGAPERIGPWRLEREIGRGGMGVVWRAVRDDGTFEQTVAIKLVRPEFASELWRRRLVGEMRILAGLEHAAIARLLDGGSTPDGVPYLALEYVAGLPIDAHCDERALPLQARLRLLVDVLSAVEYAHRRLVLHRDLKSSNILVDGAGRVKLLDFGIAKLLGDQTDREEWTALGFERPLTPEWASPEQLRGEELTTASDVYSLGVLLHVLLTGQRPHLWTGQRPDQFAREIEASGRSPYRDLARRRLAPGVEAGALRGDLEWIVAKALAPEVVERYGTAAELAADVERYLGDRPVEAHPPSLAYRARKYVSRHRAGATATAIAVSSLVVATIVSLRQAGIAEAERARADRRFGEVRQLANRFLFEFEEAIRDLPGSTPARERVVATAREYLDRLAGEAGDDITLLGELAEAYLKVGDLEGHPRKANLGHAERARASYERARAVGGAMVDLDAKGVSGRKQLAFAELRLGDLALDRGEDVEAEARYRAALPTIERALELAPGDRELRRQLGQALQRLGSLALGRGEYESARAALERYRDGAALALAEEPTAREASRDLVVASILLGDVWDEWGKPERALPIYQEALGQAELRRTTFAGAEAERDWSVASQRTIIGLRKLDRHAEALTHALATFERDELAAVADPDNARLRRDLAESGADVGRELAALGRWGEARSRFERSRRLFEELAAAEPESAEIRTYLAAALYLEAEALATTGARDAALAAVLRGSEIERAMLAQAPESPEIEEGLAASLRLLGRLRLESGERVAALADLDRAVGLEETLTRRAGRSPERDGALAAALALRSRARRDRDDRCADLGRAAGLMAGLEPGALDRLLGLPRNGLAAALAGCAPAPR